MPATQVRFIITLVGVGNKNQSHTLLLLLRHARHVQAVGLHKKLLYVDRIIYKKRFLSARGEPGESQENIKVKKLERPPK